VALGRPPENLTECPAAFIVTLTTLGLDRRGFVSFSYGLLASSFRTERETAKPGETVGDMDSQHRHELQQNELGKLANQALPFLERYGMHLVVALAAAVVGGIGAAWWYGQASASTAESWTQLESALFQQNPSADDFASVADKHPRSPAAAWAKLKEADDYFRSGMQAVYSDKEAALADLKKAQESYQKLEAGGADRIPDDVRERALFGLGRCLEALSDGNTAAAIDVYRRLIDQFPDTMFKGIALDRIKALESEDAKDFYAWFHQQSPKPRDVQPLPFKKPETKPLDDSPAPDATSGDVPVKDADAPASESPPGADETSSPTP
jgi:tetratricopeptide (TPR) repeat protein